MEISVQVREHEGSIRTMYVPVLYLRTRARPGLAMQEYSDVLLIESWFHTEDAAREHGNAIADVLRKGSQPISKPARRKAA